MLSINTLAGPKAAAPGVAAPGALELRPYQRACIEQCLAALGKGVWRQAVSLPVGSGKTVIFSNLIQRVPAPGPEATKTLVLAHREELLEQAARQIKRASPQLEVHIDQAQRVASPAADVVVASVATLGRSGSARLRRHDPARYKCIIIDEAHHAAAESYGRILEYFGRGTDEQPLLVWGCSATLRRHDGLALGEVFDQIVFHKSFLEMIREKWLSGLQVTTVQTSCSLSGVATQLGDYAPGQLSRAINTPQRNAVVVKAHATLAAGRRSTVVFAVDMAHAEDLRCEFVNSGTRAETVLSTTRAADRERILDGFRAGEFPVLVNCGILTEGTDIPTIDCVMMARPTRSTVLFQQMIGRGMRLSPGKDNCLVIDFVDSFKRTASQITIPTLLGLNPSTVFDNADVLAAVRGGVNTPQPTDESDESPEKQLVRSFEQHLAAVEPSAEMEQLGFKPHVHLNPLRFFEIGECPAGMDPAEYTRQLDCVSSGATWKLREMSPYAWVCVGPNQYLVVVSTRTVRVVYNAATQKWNGVMRLEFPSRGGKKSYATREKELGMEADSLEQAIHAIDTLLRHEMPWSALMAAQRTAGWRGRPPSPAQLKQLRRLGVALPDDADACAGASKAKPGQRLTRGVAANLIQRAMGGCWRTWRDFEAAKARIASDEDSILAEAMRNAAWITPASDA